MAKERSDKSKYKSPSTGEYCTCAQYVAEIMCNRMAEKDNQGTQAYKFWQTKKWKRTYQYQVVLANQLAQKYGCAAIVKAIHSNQLKNVYSLRYPKLEDVIRKYQKIIESENDNPTNINIQEQPKRRSTSFGKKSSLQRLRGINGNGKEEEEDK